MAILEARRLYNAFDLGPLKLRGLDEHECAVGGMTSYRAIQRSIKDSFESWSVWNEDRLVMVMGYMPQGFIGETVRAWCLTTPVVDDMTVWFARASRRCVGMLLDRYPAIEVYVWKEHRPALKWLHWLGFKNKQNDGDFIIMRRER